MGLFGNPPDIEKLKAKGDANGLTRATTYRKNPQVRKAALKALAGIEGSRALETIKVALKDEDATVRSEGIAALESIRDPRSVEMLSEALQDKAIAVRIKAAEALGRIRDARSVEPLIAAFKDTDRDVRLSVAKALGDIGDPRALVPLATPFDNRYYDHHSQEFEVLVGALSRFGSPSVEFFISVLRRPNLHDVWYRAAHSVLRTVGMPALEPLLALAGESASPGRPHAIDLLAELKVPQALGIFVDGLTDKSSRVRLAAASALTALNWQPDTVDNQVTYDLIVDNIDAVVAIGIPAVDPLIAHLKRGLFETAAIADALGRIGDSRAIAPLAEAISTMRHGNRDDRAIFQALARIGGPGLDVLFHELEADERDTFSDISQIVSDCGDQRAVPILEKALVSGWYQNRKWAARALDKLGWKPETQVIRAAYLVAKEEWDSVLECGETAANALIMNRSEPALRLLVQMGKPAVEPLIEALKPGDGTSDPFPRFVETLARIGDPRAVEPLVFYLKNNSAFDYRRAVANALDKLGWQPATNDEKCAYWIIKGQWDACVELGEGSVALLINALETVNAPRDEIGKALIRIGEPSIAALTAKLSEPTKPSHRNMTAILEAIRNPKPATPIPQEKPSDISLAIEQLVSLYDKSPRGEGFMKDSAAAKPVRAIGNQLNEAGGKALMLLVHDGFRSKRFLAARNLEMVWDGIGDWRG